MVFDPAIFLAAIGITTLELAEAAAVGLALFADSGKYSAFLYVSLGVIAVLIPTFLIGSAIALLPIVYIRLVGGVLLLYFGMRLVKSARRSVLKGRAGGFTQEEFVRGIVYTGVSVGAVEAFEAAIVLVGLLPNNFASASLGLTGGIAIVIVSTYVLRNQVRKIKQANMKVVVSSLLLSFAVFWFGEAFFELNDLLLIPLFVVFVLAVHQIANRDSGVSQPVREEAAKSGPGSSA
ncbi:MAG: hypothetical protein ACLQEQ_08675 [Nitrososphaerales archaeon]